MHQQKQRQLKAESPSNRVLLPSEQREAASAKPKGFSLAEAGKGGVNAEASGKRPPGKSN